MDAVAAASRSLGDAVEGARFPEEKVYEKQDTGKHPVAKEGMRTDTEKARRRDAQKKGLG